MKQRAGSGACAARCEQWRKVIAAAEASGQTISGFCRKYGIHPSHYYYWRQRLKEDCEVASASRSGEFVLVGTAGMAASSPAALELVVERGWRLRIGAGVEENALRVVLSALAAQA